MTRGTAQGAKVRVDRHMVALRTFAIIFCACCAGTWSPALVRADEGPARRLLLEAGVGFIHGPGPMPGLGAGVDWQLGPTPLVLGARVISGLGDNWFVALAPSLELHFCVRCDADVFLGGGAGVVLESQSGSPNVPYYGLIGFEVALSSKDRLRVAGLFGRHMLTGDEGNKPGPHLVSIGWHREL